MILGIGFDLVEIDRVKRLFQEYPKAFVSHLLTSDEYTQFKEIQHEHRQVEWLSGRFAAKEAFVKAVGTGFCESIGLHTVEVLSSSTGKPELRVKDSVFKNLPDAANIHFHLTITHTRTTAGAFVIIEQYLQ